MILEGGKPPRKITLCVTSLFFLIDRGTVCLALLMAESLVLNLLWKRLGAGGQMEAWRMKGWLLSFLRADQWPCAIPRMKTRTGLLSATW